MLVYKITSPNMPNTVYVGSTVRTKEERWNEHSAQSNDCKNSKHIIEAGGAEMDVLETVTDPTVKLVDREFFYIMKFKDAGFHVLNERMPGAIARAGGINAYNRQYRKENPESYRASFKKNDTKRLLPLECENCGCVSSKMNMKQHQRTKRCKAASTTQPTVINNITAHIVHIYN
jgi:predicted Zn-ribbon and HTH transcriptional regulator